MSDPASKPVAINRGLIGTNVVIQIVVLIALVFMANFVSYRQFKRVDFSRDSKYSLAGQTRSLLKSLKKPAHAYVVFNNGSADMAMFMDPDSQIFAAVENDLTTLLREYQLNSRGNFEFEKVNPYAESKRAEELMTKYKVGENESVLILEYDGRSKFLTGKDLGEIERGRDSARLKGFNGERAITSTLLGLYDAKPNKLYYVTGHGEPDWDGKVMLYLRETMERQNVKAETMNLANVEAVPADASVVMINGPRFDFSEREMKLLGDYWEKKGRIVVCSGWSAKPLEQLNGWLAERGVRPQNDWVNKAGRTATGEPALFEMAGTFPKSHISILKQLGGVAIRLGDPTVSPTQSLLLDQNKQQTDKLTLTPLLVSPEGFWGKTDLDPKSQELPYFDPKKDHQGPLTLAAACVKGAPADTSVKVETPRLVVVGNSGIFTTRPMEESGVGETFAVGIFNWLLDREELIDIAPREKSNKILRLDEDPEKEIRKLKILALTVILVVPLIFAMIGTVVWARRRY